MDFNFGKLVKDAGSAFNRVKQFTEEKFGSADKTELDSYYDSLAERADLTKNATEKILRDVEAVLVPNPAFRVEDYVYDKINKKNHPIRLNNLECLGADMIDAGNKIGPNTDYGSTLITVGNYERKLGAGEQQFLAKATEKYLQPMERYLNDEMRNIMREKNELEKKRLDLDVCKNRVRKARSQLGLQSSINGVSPAKLLEDAEHDMRIAQTEFDRQIEATKLLMEGVRHSYASHLLYLRAFVDEQRDYYRKCDEIMTELSTKLTPATTTTPTATATQSTTASTVDEFKTISIL